MGYVTQTFFIFIINIISANLIAILNFIVLNNSDKLWTEQMYNQPE